VGPELVSEINVVSPTDQQLHLQVDALERAGCYQVFTSGQYTVAAIATTLGVSRASIYRHLT
jgi:predicted transcriptional regulator YheO